MFVEQLFVHPLKSGRAVAVPSIDFDARGPRHDRRWLLVDANNRFITQRELPAMGRIDARPQAGGIVLSARGVPALDVPEPAPAHVRRVQVWADEVLARDAGDQAAKWLQDVIGIDARLVWQADEGQRPIRKMATREVSFADAYPLLVLSSTAVSELAARSSLAVDVRRFRPNIVIGGSVPHFEDTARRLRIGANTVLLPSACSRCSVPSLDPDSGVVTPGFNAALAAYRRREGVIYFGQNGVHEREVAIHVGDTVEVLE